MGTGRFWVVNAGGRGSTHIMQDLFPSTPKGFIGPPKKTLCGLNSTRNVSGVFNLGDVTCIECTRRYQVYKPPPKPHELSPGAWVGVALGVCVMIGILVGFVMLVKIGTPAP